MTGQDTNAGRWIYIAGPMTGIPDFNRPRFHEVAAQLRAPGYWHVISPAETFGRHDDLPWTTYMREGVRAVADCQAILLLEGWRNSRGAKLESHIAKELGLRRFETVSGALFAGRGSATCRAI